MSSEARHRRWLLVIGLVCVVSLPAPATAQATVGGVVSQVGFDQKLGAQLPLELRFRDEQGASVPLAELFGRRPVILAPVYYRCPLLCNQLLNGLTRSLKPVSLGAGKDFDVVAFSINPDETPRSGWPEKAAYLEQYDRPGSEVGWHFLTGDAGVDQGPGRGDRISLHVQPGDQALCPRRGRGHRDP